MTTTRTVKKVLSDRELALYAAMKNAQLMFEGYPEGREKDHWQLALEDTLLKLSRYYDEKRRNGPA